MGTLENHQISNLKASSHLYEETIALIEDAFEYNREHSFKIDFYPLMREGNRENCHILIKDNKVVAHIGALQAGLSLNSNEYTITMFGGIAVHPDYRGQNLFSELFSQVKENYLKSTLHILWSDKLNLYRKQGFIPCGQLLEYPQAEFQHELNVLKTKLSNITNDEQEQISKLYSENGEVRISRTQEDWETLKGISSADLILYKDGEKIINYCVINKGQDLTGIVHEYGFINEEFIKIFANHGKVWTPLRTKLNHNALFAFLACPNNLVGFKAFIKDLSKIEILEQAKEQYKFDFNNETYYLAIEDFLQGVFGPGRFNELDSPFLYISGLDSI